MICARPLGCSQSLQSEYWSLFNLRPAIEFYCFVFQDYSDRGGAWKFTWKSHQQILWRAQAAIFRCIFLLPLQRQVAAICYLKQQNFTVLVAIQTGEGCITCFSFGQNICISRLAIPTGSFKKQSSLSATPCHIWGNTSNCVSVTVSL